jgi:hypothetical protein
MSESGLEAGVRASNGVGGSARIASRRRLDHDAVRAEQAPADRVSVDLGGAVIYVDGTRDGVALDLVALARERVDEVRVLQEERAVDRVAGAVPAD